MYQIETNAVNKKENKMKPLEKNISKLIEETCAYYMVFNYDQSIHFDQGFATSWLDEEGNAEIIN